MLAYVSQSCFIDQLCNISVVSTAVINLLTILLESSFNLINVALTVTFVPVCALASGCMCEVRAKLRIGLVLTGCRYLPVGQRSLITQIFRLDTSLCVSIVY